MPEFLGRPNLPNALANSLVQLAQAETDPLAVALGQVGKLADNYTAYQTNMKMLEKKAELEDKQAEKQFQRQKELKKLDTDAQIFEKLLSSDRIIGGLMGDKGLSSGEAEGLLAGVQAPRAKTRKLVEGDFGKRAPAAEGEGTPLSSVGVNIPGDPRFTPSKEKVKVDEDMAKRFGLPTAAIGKTLTMDQVVALRRSEGSGKGGAGRDPDMIEADLPTRMAAIDAAYDALATIKGGGKVPEPPPKPELPKKKGTSIFGFTFGGDETPAPAAAKSPAKPAVSAAGTPTPKISREERLKRLKAKGFK